MPQWTLFEKDFSAIDQVLFELLERTNALSVHLIDRSGQLITTAGRTADFDATSFASLVAADFTANTELAQLMGETGIEAVVGEEEPLTLFLPARGPSDPVHGVRSAEHAGSGPSAHAEGVAAARLGVPRVVREGRIDGNAGRNAGVRRRGRTRSRRAVRGLKSAISGAQ